MPAELTHRQSQILEYITASIDERGFPPTLREIGQYFGIKSTNGVNDHLKALERKGFLLRDHLKSRAMRPVRQNNVTSLIPGSQALGHDLCEVPILGRVAAGQPLLAVESVEDKVQVDSFFLGGHREVFGLRVVGESMIEDGIFDGDYVFVKKTSSANKGDTVVAMIEGEATVKRYYPEGSKIRFQPANCNMEPIYVHQKDFRSVDIIGIVVGVYRKM